MRLEFSYNTKGKGPKIATWGDKPFLAYLSNLQGGKKVHIDCITIEAGYYYHFNRQWFTDWDIQVYQWINGGLKVVGSSVFLPTHQTTHFYLEGENLLVNRDYARACFDYIKNWDITNYLIETEWDEELNQEFSSDRFVKKIDYPEACYVNYVIGKYPSSGEAFENYGVPLVNEEVIFYNFFHPYYPGLHTPYEFARSILFGPDYKTIEKFIPHSWSIGEKIVY